MKQVVCSAPGKVIITGEHSVVYGEPALLAALDLRAKATVKKIEKPIVRLVSDAIEGYFEGSVSDLVDAWERARSAWSSFYKQDKQDELILLRNEPFLVMMCACGLVLGEAGEVSDGFEVSVSSQLPMISGFGSSAYTAAIVIGGVGKFLGRRYSKSELFERVYEIEKIMHGNPSGGDPMVVVNGGLIRFKKNRDGFEFNKLKLDKNVLRKVFLINSGKAVETTADLVVGEVGERLKNNPRKYKKIIKRMGEVSEELMTSLKINIFQYELLRENERLLEELGVVGEKAKNMIRKIEHIGGVAKISGGGGVRQGSGLMIAYHQKSKKLKELIKREKWQNFATSLGGEGWKIE